LSAPGSEARRKDWHALGLGEAVLETKSNEVAGLTGREAHHRLEALGPNEVATRKRTPAIILFLKQFNDFMIWVLLAAIVISGALLREYIDAVVILVIVLLNATLGFAQESRAETALERLKELSAPTVKVIRDGAEREIPARELVPGDLMLLETGDSIAADARLITAINLLANESSLTGESEAVSKDAGAVLDARAALGDRVNMVFSGTHVEYGRGTALVVETGAGTQLGEIAGMLQETKQEATPLQVELRDVGRRIVYACLIIVAIVFGIGIARGNGTAAMLLVSVSLAVAAIPEALPAMVNITLARGTQSMAKQNAIIRNLPAVETLGSAVFICSDKTGTLTENRMKVTDVLFADGSRCLLEDACSMAQWHASAVEAMERAAALCNDARPGPEGYIGDPTEVALLRAAEEAGLDKLALEEQFPRVAEVPFDSDRKMMTTFNRLNGSFVAYTKGAAEQVLARSAAVLTAGGEVALTDAGRARLAELSAELGSQGLRTLAVARRPIDALPRPHELGGYEEGLVFLGVFAMKDPPRGEVMQSLTECRRARIHVAMITGDHRATASAVARELEILVPGRHVLEGHDLEDMSAEELSRQVEDTSVYARVSPRHKVKIVEALKSRGHVVAMTGDGVNDAPALKRADIGVAMGITGTDVAKEASDMVLADDNFASIVAAVRQGRIIFANLKKFIYYLLSCNISEVLVIFISMVAGFPLPLVASQILWINMVTDSLPALALGMEPPERDVMEHPPRRIDENILAVPKQLNLLWQGLLITAGALASFILARYLLGYDWSLPGAAGPHNLAVTRTILFTTMVLTQIFHSYNMRSETKSFLTSAPWQNVYLFGSFLITVGLQMAVLYLPFMHKAFHTQAPTWQAWVLILSCAIVPVLLIDRIKVIKAHYAK